MSGFAAVFGLAACAQPVPAVAPAPLTFLQAPVSGGLALVGSTPQILAAEIGQPALRRIDGTSQVWLYHSPVCGLNLILFPDAAGVPRVATAVPDGVDTASCMASLQRQAQAGQDAAQTAALEHPAAS